MTYDTNDWNFIGQDIRNYKLSIKNFIKYPVIFIFCLLLSFGFIFYYSAYSSLNNNVILNYSLYVIIGLTLGVIFFKSNKNVLSVISPVSLVISFVVYIITNNSSYLALLMLFLYIAFYSSNRDNVFTNLQEFLYPLIVSVLFIIISFFKHDIMTVIFFAIELSFVFAVCSVGYKNILLFDGFVFIPLIFFLLTNYTAFSSLMNFFKYPNNSKILNTLVETPITGVGIGASSIKENSVFLNFINETGLIGVVVYVLLLFIILFIGIKYVSLFKYSDTFRSNTLYISTLFIIFNSVIPVLNELYIIPVFDLSIPFLNADLSLTSVIISFFLFFKCFKETNENKDIIISGDNND